MPLPALTAPTAPPQSIIDKRRQWGHEVPSVSLRSPGAVPKLYEAVRVCLFCEQFFSSAELQLREDLLEVADAERRGVAPEQYALSRWGPESTQFASVQQVAGSPPGSPPLSPSSSRAPTSPPPFAPAFAATAPRSPTAPSAPSPRPATPRSFAQMLATVRPTTAAAIFSPRQPPDHPDSARSRTPRRAATQVDSLAFRPLPKAALQLRLPDSHIAARPLTSPRPSDVAATDRFITPRQPERWRRVMAEVEQSVRRHAPLPPYAVAAPPSPAAARRPHSYIPTPPAPGAGAHAAAVARMKTPRERRLRTDSTATASAAFAPQSPYVRAGARPAQRRPQTARARLGTAYT